MTERQKIISRISLAPTVSIRQAMQVMTRAPRSSAAVPAGLIVVTDRTQRLLGIATDGDIRRGIERGATLASPIRAVMNPRPFTIEGMRSNSEILALVLEKIKKERWRRDKIRHIVITDPRGRILDVLSFFDVWRNSEVRLKNIGVIGLGYVGLTLALTLADHGFQVRGTDVNPFVLRTLRRGTPHFYEVGLAELLGDHLGKTFDVVDRLRHENHCDMYIIAVGTPVNTRGIPNFHPLQKASRAVGRIVKHGDAVILRSTVPVGTTRSVVIPILEHLSGLIAGRDFYVAFAPERTVEGNALAELKNLPQVIGGIDRVSSEITAHVFNTITSHSILVDSLEEAEMVKLINNTYRDVTFAFANELALICRRWGMDTRKVIEAANRDYDRSRVPAPSPGVGGYCLKKDPFIFIASARKKRYTPLLALRARQVSAEMVQSIAGDIREFLRKNKRPPRRSKVCIMGLAFKGEPVTSDFRDSTAIDLARELMRRGVSVLGYDPAVDGRAMARRGIRYVADLGRALAHADALIVMNNNPSFRNFNMRQLLMRTRRPALVIDGWAMFPAEEMQKVKHISYRRI